MSFFIVNLDWESSYNKGDSIDLPCTVNEDLTGAKIRVELYDKLLNSIKLATANSGGSNTQIEITDPSNGKFTIYIPKDETDCFADKAFIEIERENSNGKIKTFINRHISLKNNELDWETPS